MLERLFEAIFDVCVKPLIPFIVVIASIIGIIAIILIITDSVYNVGEKIFRIFLTLIILAIGVGGLILAAYYYSIIGLAIFGIFIFMVFSGV